MMPQLSQHSLHTKRKNQGNSFQFQSNCFTVRCRGAALHSHSSTVRCRAAPSSNATVRPPAAEGQGPFSNSIAPPLAAEGQLSILTPPPFAAGQLQIPMPPSTRPLPRGRSHSPNPSLHHSPPRGSSPFSFLHRSLPRGSATASGQPEGAGPGPLGAPTGGAGAPPQHQPVFFQTRPAQTLTRRVVTAAVLPRTRGGDNAHQHMFCRGWALDVSEIQIVCPPLVA